MVRLVRTVDAGTTFCYVQKDRLRRLPGQIEMAPGDPFGLARALVTAYGPLWTLGVATNPRCSDEQVDEIRTMQVAAGITGKQMVLVLSRDFGVQEVADLRPEQAVALVARLAAKAAAATNPTSTTNPTPTEAKQGN